MQVRIVDLSTITGVKDNLCYGIARTNEMSRKMAESYRTDLPIYVYFHLPAGASAEQREQTRQTLKRRFLPMAHDVLLVDRIEDVPAGMPFIMGTRGASPQVRQEVEERLQMVLDTTCPYVTSQEAAARKLLQDGYQVVFCGLSDYHGLPRLRGIARLFDREIYVAHEAADVAKLPFRRSTRVGAILQTTWHMSLAKEAIAELLGRFREVRVIDTSCIDSLGRVPAARRISEESDLVVVVDIGGVSRYLEEELAELGSGSQDGAAGARVFRIENRDQIQAEWFEGAETVSILGGINVHRQVLEGVAERIREIRR